MPIRIAKWEWRLWRPSLVLLALMLAACGASQGAAPPATTTPGAPAGATSAAPTATPILATGTSAKAVASPIAVLTSAPPTNTAPAVTAPPAGPTATATPDPAIAAVLAYLDARTRADVTALTDLSCNTWKTKAVTEAVSFRSMNAKLVGVTCQVNGAAGAFTLVGCRGKMVTTYGTETRDWDMSAFIYQVIAEAGQWKMCGYH